MITPSDPITAPAQVYDGIWINSITIGAPNPTAKVSANIRLTPFNSTSSVLAPQSLAKNIYIADVIATASVNAQVGSAMEAIYSAVQGLIASGSIY